MKTRLSQNRIRLFLLFLALSPVPLALSQIPQGFNYQAIARDGLGNALANQALPVKIAIQTSLTGGTLIYEELFSSVTSNQFGLISLVVGTGIQTGGSAASFSAIDWKAQTLFLNTTIQYPGTTWTTMGTSQIWAVPYSLVANDIVTKQTLSLTGTNLSISGGNSVSLVTGTNQ
jgi:trimeric autotransporter adhesin